MKLTRRRLARMLTISAAIPAAVSAQSVRGSGSVAAPPSDAEAASARDEFREAARVLAAVKLPRSAEPATRFEA
jgi:hypothetical protein